MKFTVKHPKEVKSTNALAKEMASKGHPEGLVLVADHQTDGYGKLGRKWISPAGKNLLFSILLRPDSSAHRIPLITQVICRSIASVLKNKYQITSSFKRPNDVMVNGKKICGVLVEASSQGNGKVDHAVIGIGLNVNSLTSELIPEATSIREIKGRSYKMDTALKSFLKQIDQDIKKFYAYTS